MQKKWTRKFYSTLLALSLIFTLFNPAFVFAAPTSKKDDLINKDNEKMSQIEEIVDKNESLLEESPELNQKLRTMDENEDEDVSVIVQLSEAPVALVKGSKKIQQKSFSLAEENTIKKKVGSQQQTLLNELNNNNIEFKEGHKYDHVLNGMAITVKAGDVDKLTELEGVVRVDPDEEMHALDNSPSNGDAKRTADKSESSDHSVTPFMDVSVPHLDIPDLWNQGVTGEDVKVAVLDTGIDYEHPDFEGVYQGGYNFVEHDDDYTTERDDDDPYETTPEERADGVPEFNEQDSAFYTSHGTHVAGTIAGQGNNDYDINGVAPDIDLYAYRVLGAYGSGMSSGIISAIEKAAKEDMDIINLSLGGGGNNQDSPDAVAINNAVLDGVTPIISTGNSGPGRETIGNPSASAYAISVGNSTLPEATYEAHLDIEANDFESEYNASLMAWEYATDPGEELLGQYDVVAVPDWGEPADYENLDVEGNIALVSRGETPFVNKISTAEEAGAEGVMIHNNVEKDGPSDVSLGTSFDFIPAFDISTADGEALREAIETSDDNTGTVTFSDYSEGESDGDMINESSSQGPTSPAFDIKPDVVAPGTNIMSTVPEYGKAYDDADYDKAYDVKTGTSMAAPHVTGIAALMLSKHDDWDPFDVKVALSNTAKQLDTDAFDVFTQGPGLVQPFEAVNAEALAYALDETTYTDDGVEVEEEYEKGTVTFGRISPDPDAETTVTKQIEVRDLVGKSSDYDVDVEVTEEATGELAEADVTVSESSFTLDGEEMLDVTLTVPAGEEEPGNEILGYVHLTSDSNEMSLPFAAEFDTTVPTGLEHYFLDDVAIAPGTDGVEETELNFSLYDDQQIAMFEVWSAADEGPAEDHYVGLLDGGAIPAGSYILPVDGTYVEHLTGEEIEMSDGVYSIDFRKLSIEDGSEETLARAPIMVKTSDPEIDFDEPNEKIDSTEYTVTGAVDDAFIDFKEIYEESFDESYDINEYLTAEYELLTDDDDAEVDSGVIELDQNGSFEIPLSDLESGADYSLSVDVDDVVGISNETKINVPVAVTNTDELKTRVERYEEAGDFTNESVARALKIHLTSVGHFESREKTDKVIKHMKGFKKLLEHQKNEKLIPEDIYETLKADSDHLLNKWQ